MANNSKANGKRGRGRPPKVVKYHKTKRQYFATLQVGGRTEYFYGAAEPTHSKSIPGAARSYKGRSAGSPTRKQTPSCSPPACARRSTRKTAGDGVWCYTCLAPGGPWINRLLDQERVRPVYVGWALVKYDLAGFLHWGMNHYQGDSDPFAESCVPFPKPPDFLPAGDSHIVFPGQDGPLAGQRMEAHRIGFEDAELLRMLKARDAAQADAIIGRVFRAFDDYEKDVTAYRAARRALLEALAK
jgi:hypothetical protein